MANLGTGISAIGYWPSISTPPLRRSGGRAFPASLRRPANATRHGGSIAGEAFLFTHPASQGNKAAVGSDSVFWIHHYFTKGVVQIEHVFIATGRPHGFSDAAPGATAAGLRRAGSVKTRDFRSARDIIMPYHQRTSLLSLGAPYPQPMGRFRRSRHRETERKPGLPEAAGEQASPSFFGQSFDLKAGRRLRKANSYIDPT